MKRFSRLLVASAFVSCVLSAGLASASASTPQSAAAAKPPFKIALSMSYVGNDWQNEAENLVKAIAATPPYDKLTKLRVDIAGASVPKQIQQINSEVAAGFNALIVYPISPTALNVAIRNACNKGVLVFDYNANVTEPCAYNIKTSDTQFGYAQAAWLAKLLHGKGNVVEITGVAGTEPDNDRQAGWAAVLKKHPGMKVIASGNGMWDQAITKNVFSGIYAAHKGQIDGVLAEVGCWGVEQVLQAQNAPLVPCAGEAANGHRIMMLPKAKGGEGLKSISVGGPAYTGELAFMYAVDILQGKKYKHNILVPLPQVTNKNLKAGTDVAKGANVFPVGSGVEVPPGFFTDFWSPLVGQGLVAALTGRPDPVNKPKPCTRKNGCYQSDSQAIFKKFTGPTVGE